jgi:hypothetical protein
MYQVQENNGVGEEGGFSFKYMPRKRDDFTERRDSDYVSAGANTKTKSERRVINYFSLETFRK